MRVVIVSSETTGDGSCCCGETCDCSGCPDGYWTQYTVTVPAGTVTDNFGTCDCSVYNGNFTLNYIGNCRWASTATSTNPDCGVTVGAPLWVLTKGPLPGDDWVMSNEDGTLTFETPLGGNVNCIDALPLEAGPQAFGACRIILITDITANPAGTFVPCPP